MRTRLAASGPAVYVFAKEPTPGRVKTRLAAAIGDAAAASAYAEMLAGLARGLQSQAWSLSFAVTPDTAVDTDAAWPAGPPRTPQGDGDLGERMARFLRRASPPAPIVIVGSDIPEITPQHIRDALTALQTHDLVFGPSPDGGYWLIGASSPPPPMLFQHVRWSSASALADTLANCRGRSVGLLEPLEDVDDLASWRRYLARRSGAAGGAA